MKFFHPKLEGLAAILIALMFLGGIVYAVEADANWYRLYRASGNNIVSNQKILRPTFDDGTQAACSGYKYTGSGSIFVPAKTAAEFSSFASNAPNLNVSACLRTGSHSTRQCLDAGGVIRTANGSKFCLFDDRWSCPSGWTDNNPYASYGRHSCTNCDNCHNNSCPQADCI